MRAARPLPAAGADARLHRALARVRARGRVLVALSGGADSMALLHLLRFGGTDRCELAAAHFDHRMRPDSSADAP